MSLTTPKPARPVKFWQLSLLALGGFVALAFYAFSTLPQPAPVNEELIDRQFRRELGLPAGTPVRPEAHESIDRTPSPEDNPGYAQVNVASHSGEVSQPAQIDSTKWSKAVPEFPEAANHPPAINLDDLKFRPEGSDTIEGIWGRDWALVDELWKTGYCEFLFDAHGHFVQRGWSSDGPFCYAGAYVAGQGSEFMMVFTHYFERGEWHPYPEVVYPGTEYTWDDDSSALIRCKMLFLKKDLLWNPKRHQYDNVAPQYGDPGYQAPLGP